jgi:xylulokinase
MTPDPSAVLIGIDLGTTGVKVIALDPGSAVIVASAAAEYPSASTPDGGHEQNPADWWRAVASCSRKVVAALGGRAVAAVGLSGHMHSLLLLDADGEPVRPAMTWADRRVGEDTRRLGENGAFRALGGNGVVDAFTAPKLAWLARTEPDALARARRLILAKDYIGNRLTGQWATDETDAIGTLLYDVTASEWSDELFAAAGASVDLAVPVLRSTDSRGAVTPWAAASTALPAGTPVMAGAGDVSAAVVGAGVADARRICLNVGTAAQVMGLTSSPAAGTGFMFGSALRAEGAHRYISMASVYAAGASVRWASQTVLGKEDINVLAASSVPGSRGLSYLPFMYGAAAPRKNDAVRAAFLGQTERHGRPELASAVIEGIAFACADAIDAVASVAGAPSEVHVVGGVANSSVWRSALASVIDASLVHVPEGGSALGAAILAGLGAGLYDSPDDAMAHVRLAPVPRPSQADVSAYCKAQGLYRDWCDILV